MLLKDYLARDLSSCSSSGFQSLPRYRCCAAVKFHPRGPKRRPNVGPVRRATSAVVNAVKSIGTPKTWSFHVWQRFLIKKVARRRVNLKEGLHLSPCFEIELRRSTSDLATVVSSAGGSSLDGAGTTFIDVDVDPFTKKGKLRDNNQQRSPTSVLNFPYEDDSQSGGRKPESSNLEPVVLLERYSQEDQLSCSSSRFSKGSRENKVKGRRELNEFEKIDSCGVTSDDLISGIIDGMGEMGDVRGHEVTLGWQCEKGRRAYLNEMDNWMNLQEDIEVILRDIQEGTLNSLLEEALQAL